MKVILRLLILFLLTTLAGLSFPQNLPKEDPLNILITATEPYKLKSLAVNKWEDVFSKHLDIAKARFFYIDNPVDFIEYLEGNHIPQGIRLEEARDAVEETIGFTAMYASNGLYSKEDIDYYIRKSRDFWTVRYCPIELRESFYKNYNLLLYLRSRIQ